MGWNDHIGDAHNNIVSCKHCGKKYIQRTEDQQPGFRERDYDRCPYCGKDNGSSMEVEYLNRKLEEE